jgi:hypothetical protein
LAFRRLEDEAGRWPLACHEEPPSADCQLFRLNRFTPEAVTYADRVAARVILLDGLALSGLMVRYNIGVQDQQTYVIKRVDEDFFDES